MKFNNMKTYLKCIVVILCLSIGSIPTQAGLFSKLLKKKRTQTSTSSTTNIKNETYAERTFTNLFNRCLFDRNDKHSWIWFVNQFIGLLQKYKETFKARLKLTDTYMAQVISMFKQLKYEKRVMNIAQALGKYKAALPESTKALLRDKGYGTLYKALKDRLAVEGVVETTWWEQVIEYILKKYESLQTKTERIQAVMFYELSKQNKKNKEAAVVPPAA